ncbi:hypothetical protein PUNSTDRAFT_139906 [Punctularia strigosozonata HHB-11173 SS5]|uniref:uncharacterized protein n=1 Tax=Punctularia strigosozonata (strain HHB-11173) TaxID=741275 RepID=UPI0004417E1C|nr:uncharacterized protein PUNSTDRAFT_139906 [Punctularia strigosozonata HHB-11173 SS5]EIN13329.1 hypothetical protein PUNSTDRAFT_139906 [Punctularia strigosozonata HHB-11173 SS5]
MSFEEDQTSDLKVLWDHAVLLHDQYETSSDLARLETAIAEYRLIAAAHNTGDATSMPSCRLVLSALSRALIRHYERLGNGEDITEAVSLLQETLPLTKSDTERADMLMDLAIALRVESDLPNKESGLDEAVAVGREALLLSVSDTQQRASALITLSRVVGSLYLRRSSEEYLDECLSLANEGLQIAADDHPLRALAYYSLSVGIFCKVENSGVIADLDKGEEAAKRSLDLRPPGHPDRHMSFHALSIIADLRFHMTGDLIDLDKAVSFAKEVVALRPVGHPARAAILTNLAGQALSRWQRSDDVADLESALKYGRDAVALQPEINTSRSVALNNLAEVLRLRYRRLGNAHLDDLDESILLLREASSMVNPGHWSWTGSLNNLSAALKDRYEQRGDPADLEEMVKLARDSVTHAEPGEHLRGDNIYNLADALRLRFERFENVEDLNEAIELLRSIQRPVDHPTRANDLVFLGGSLFSRYQKQHERADLDQAIAVLQQAMSSCERKDILVYALRWLAQAQATRAIHFPSPDGVEVARAVFDRALQHHPTGHSERMECLFARAEFEVQLENDDSRLLALNLAYEAINDNNAHPQQRLTRAFQLFERLREPTLASLRSDSDLSSRVIDIYGAAVEMLPKVAYFGMGIDSRLRALGRAGAMCPDVVAYAGPCSRMNRALEILEASRTVFWTQALRLRTSFDNLPIDIREELSSLSRQLERGSFITSTGSSALSRPLLDEHEQVQRRKDTERLNSLMEQTRCTPGFERCLLHDEFSTLAEAASQGPIVVLVSSPLSCDAIVLPNPGSILRVALPSVTEGWLQQSSIAWRTSTARARGQLRDDRLLLMKRPVTCGSREKLIKVENAILAELWVRVVEPIIRELKLRKATGRDRPRLWWCCSGAFSFLPVHAATTQSESCFDYVVSSYVPSLGTLLTTRRTAEPLLPNEARVLLAAEPSPLEAQMVTLPHAAEEIERVISILPCGTSAVLPSPTEGTAATQRGGTTVQELLDSLPDANILHLACHGSQRQGNPLESAFHLRDGSLSIAQIMQVPLPRAFLAFLSACETAKGDTMYAEQGIHLGAAMLFAGFKSVVGTMWSMDDVDGPIVAETVYKHLFASKSEHLDPNVIPYSLDAAIGTLREEGAPPHRWATYVHLGM